MGAADNELDYDSWPDGNRDGLKARAEARGGFQMAPQSKSKFERALAIVDGAAAGTPDAPAESAAEAQSSGDETPAIVEAASEPQASTNEPEPTAETTAEPTAEPHPAAPQPAKKPAKAAKA